MAFRLFLLSNSEHSVSQTHSGLVPVWNVRRHIHVSMAVTVGQLVNGRRVHDCLLVFAVTITTLPRWIQRRKWSVTIVQITYWSKMNITLVKNKEGATKLHFPESLLHLFPLLHKILFIHRHFLPLLLYMWEKKSDWQERKQTLLESFRLKTEQSYWLACFHKHKCSISASDRC